MTTTAEFFEQAFPHLAKPTRVTRVPPPLPVALEECFRMEMAAAAEEPHMLAQGASPVTNEGTACVAGEIKSLEHWRKLDEVARKLLDEAPVGWLASTDKAASGVTTKPKSWFFSDGELQLIAEINARRVTKVVMPEIEIRASLSPVRSPFPARALRDRPWDISALVEE